jgi:hypothetical protein
VSGARRFTEQIVVRVDPNLAAWLRADARRYGRTVAQSIRWHLDKAADQDAAR